MREADRGSEIMPQRNLLQNFDISQTTTLFYILLAGSAIAGSLLGTYLSPEWRWLHYLTKPTATAFLLHLTLSVHDPASRHYRNAIALGLFFAIGGDFFLMLPQDYFIAGLICFLLTHCAYIYALLSDHAAFKPAIFLGFAAIALMIISGLWSSLPAGMHIPVAIYAAALALMAALALNRAMNMTIADRNTKNAAKIAAFGAIFFVVSDTMLAYGRFRFDIPFNPLWVLGTYYTAQWCFARSVLRGTHG